MSLKSKTTAARPGSTSLRATVPEGIVAFLDLKEGDKLEWKMQIDDGKRIATVEKLLSYVEADQIAMRHSNQKK